MPPDLPKGQNWQLELYLVHFAHHVLAGQRRGMSLQPLGSANLRVCQEGLRCSSKIRLAVLGWRAEGIGVFRPHYVPPTVAFSLTVSNTSVEDGK